MPAIILTGHPQIGKTSLSHLIAQRAKEVFHISNVFIINEENCCSMTKVGCYRNAQSEKVTRAALKSAFERALSYTSSASVSSALLSQGSQRQHHTSKNKKKQLMSLVILDSLNYIKGYRYELHW